jgi:hypothetical protein
MTLNVHQYIFRTKLHSRCITKRFLARKDRPSWTQNRVSREHHRIHLGRSSQQVCLTSGVKNLEIPSLIPTVRIADFLFTACLQHSFTLSFTSLKNRNLKTQTLVRGNEWVSWNYSDLTRLLPLVASCSEYRTCGFPLSCRTGTCSWKFDSK